MAEGPPSTRSMVGAVVVPAMASTPSRTWKLMATTMARARWARPMPRLSPTMVPRASGSQYGLPSPVNAGTTTKPSLVSTDRASGSISAASGRRLHLGRLPDDAEAVPHPLHAGPRDEDRSFEGVGHRPPAARAPVARVAAGAPV